MNHFDKLLMGVLIVLFAGGFSWMWTYVYNNQIPDYGLSFLIVLTLLVPTYIVGSLYAKFNGED